MIIGFTGPMGCGKSTAIQVLKDIGGQACTLIKFAQPLYDIQEYAYDRIKGAYSRPETFIKDRKLLQWIGTEWGRDTVSKTLWVDVWKAEAAKYVYMVDGKDKSGALVVCDDVRFDNEAETIKSLGGVIVQIKGPSRAMQDGIKFHSSESGINPTLVDFTINNEGYKDEFQEKIQKLYRSLA